jgi:hypothetical protein
MLYYFSSFSANQLSALEIFERGETLVAEI